MISINSLSFCRRLNSLKPSRWTLKNTQYPGNVKYLSSCQTKLLKQPIPSVNLCKYYVENCDRFRNFNRFLQTSSKPKDGAEGISSVAEEPTEKLSLFKRYHKMLKEYWYVLLPVHFVTSAFWFGGFYYAAKSGIDIVPFLEYINVPEKFVAPLKNSALGYIAVASAFYKLATPARYMVTLGGTTVTVKFLTKRGLIRPVPTKAQIKTIIQNKLKKDT